MEIDDAVRAQLPGMDPRPLDFVLALLLTVGALLDAASELHRGLDALTAVSLVVATSTVAWRRAFPVLATLVAIGALTAFELASSYNPAAMKNTSVKTAIRRGWRRARFVNEVSTGQPFPSAWTE